MKKTKLGRSIALALLGMLCLPGVSTAQDKMSLQSGDGQNEISLSLNNNGALTYKVLRKNKTIIAPSALGIDFIDQSFTSGLVVKEVSATGERTENYQLIVANNKGVDHTFKQKSITFANKAGGLMIVDLVAGQEGVAFRYRFPQTGAGTKQVTKEATAFTIGKGKGWLQPYDKAGDYTPGYEDFYLAVNAGDPITNPRNPAVGWCMPALFNVNNGKTWVLIAETGNEGAYPGCHLNPDSDGGIYTIGFAKKDEKFTLPLPDKEVYPESKTPWEMPWRTIIIGDGAGDILLSTMITDLAPASKIADTSWIEPGKAGWSWWSHPDDHSPEIYKEFTELSASFGFKYTLFDAGWEKANAEGGIIADAAAKGVKPLVWGYSSEYFDPERRKKRFKELAAMGVKGVKIDFWCSDRQEVMAALQGVFEDAAKEHLLVNLHGTTMPRGWHRTWPHFMTAEAILGTESYFYEPRFPEMAASQNTILPFTRNVAGPADYTPFALTMRQFTRLNTAVHELATAMTYTSGIIHFADSKEVFDSLPAEVKSLLKDMPATWDKTECVVADPGNMLVLYRQKDSHAYIVGINGTNTQQQLKIDLARYGKGYSKVRIITEGANPLMDFKVETLPISKAWKYNLAPKGGFILEFVK